MPPPTQGPPKPGPRLAPWPTLSTTMEPIGLIRRHQGAVWRQLRWLGCSTAAADDLTQETFVRVLGRGFEPRSEAQTAAFLKKTARNVWREHCRAGRRDCDAMGKAGEDAWAEAATRAFEDAERNQDARIDALRDCVEQLDHRKRRAVDGFYRDRLSHDALAEALGLKPGGVKILLQRVRSALRTCIDLRLAADGREGDIR